MKKDIAWNTFGNIFYGFCTWVITILVVRMGSFTDAGYLSLAMTTSSTYNAIALFAMRNYQITDSGHLYSDSEYVSSRIISCLAAYVFLAVAAAFSGSVYQAVCIIAFMPVRLSESYSDVFHGIDQMHDRYDLIGKSFTLRGIAVIVIFIAGMAATGNLALTLGLISIATFLISILWDQRLTSKIATIKMRLRDSKILKLYLSCLPLMLFTFFMGMQMMYAKTVLSEVVGVTKQGIYASISNPTYAVQVMGAALFAPYLPVLAEYLKEKDTSGFSRGVRKVTGILIIFSGMVIVAAELFGRWVLGIFFGRDILDYYELFIPVVIVIIINTFVYWFQGVLVALRKNVLLAVGMIADFILFSVLIRPAIEIFGMNGASYAQILSLGLYLVFEITATAVASGKLKKS
ncbi:MAG: lipopolysaccharide biosynthesis protein [Candidatus Weimeria sp.]